MNISSLLSSLLFSSPVPFLVFSSRFLSSLIFSSRFFFLDVRHSLVTHLSRREGHSSTRQLPALVGFVNGQSAKGMFPQRLSFVHLLHVSTSHSMLSRLVLASEVTASYVAVRLIVLFVLRTLCCRMGAALSG